MGIYSEVSEGWGCHLPAESNNVIRRPAGVLGTGTPVL